MTQITAVTGQAGTGKTTWLMQKAAELAPSFLVAEHDSMLAITRMHGSRRRLVAKLAESCPSLPYAVTTIDGFALTIANRWRTALGYTRPIQPVSDDVAFSDTILGTEAGFAQIVQAATRLLASATIKAVIRESYPLVMIDEFQDCHGPLLDFVKAIAACSHLLLAADDFQFLDSSVSGCPAIEWVRQAENGGTAACTSLVACHRTSNQGILAAAKCLRDNTAATSTTVPVLCCPNCGPAAFKIMDALRFRHATWTGSTALICPSHDSFIDEVLSSLQTQLAKRNLHPMSWFHEASTSDVQKQLCESLGVSDANPTAGWSAPSGPLDPAAAQVVTRTKRFSKLKGMASVPHAIVARHVDTVVHERRAYSPRSPKRVITTVHGAKNREFDNVIVLWPYTVPSDADQKRRLLYNAVTRAKNNCMVLVRGNKQRAAKDSALALLGPAQDAFPPKTGKRRTAKKKAKA